MSAFLNLDIKVQAAIISAVTAIIVMVMGWMFKVFYDRYSLSHRLKKEYSFEQKKKLKDEIAKTKISVLNAAEEFNYRMWNFNQNINKEYHQIKKENWFKTKQYYLNSFIYRFLLLVHFCIKIEEEAGSIDSTVADKEDLQYLKYIKSLKNIFCEINLLKELNYSLDDESKHFFRNELKTFSSRLIKEEKPMEFDEFCKVLENEYENFDKVIEYFSTIENRDTDEVLNTLRCVHMVIISFLNDFGHSYQHTDKQKKKVLANQYAQQILVKNGFSDFVRQNKLESELKFFTKKLI